jgi:hypothetical protein
MRLRLAGLSCGISMVLIFLSVSVLAEKVAQKVERATLVERAAPRDSVRAALQAKVASILKSNCAVSGCHTGKHPEEKLLLDPSVVLKSTKNVPSREIRSLMRVNTEKPEESYLLMKIRGDVGIRGERMPRGEPPLKKEEIRAIELWLQSLSVPEKAK